MVGGGGHLPRIGAADVRQALDDIPDLETVLPRHVLALQEQVPRIAACNGNHARWLLMAHDPAGPTRSR